MYRLLAIDLDGTLLTPQPNKIITSRTRQALARAAEAGINVVIATGQNLAVLRHVCGELPLQGPQIIENGAVIADLQGTIYHEKPFPGEYILPVLNTLHTFGFYRAYHTIHRVYVDKDTPRARSWYRPPVPPAIEVEDVASLYPLQCIKLVGIGDESKIRGRRSELESLFEGKLYVTQSSFDLIEFLHPAVSKGNALKVIAADLHIQPEEIVAFGDNHNDIGMLQFAGLGIAMGNAHQEVQSMANYVTASNAEEGVAQAIEDLVLPTIR
ncbi:MAG TPA: Cof-type HAD-IIB family hydrolase [Ktedonobacteraceae bacterium]|nr:Cof-type HAD-IIB family hydrolase [Ktedonobacteraceae bacterium]